LLWLLSKTPLGPDGRLASRAPRAVDLRIPGLSAGTYAVRPFDTVTGEPAPRSEARSDGNELPVTLQLVGDLAVAVRRHDT
jgi:hypothetical protein